MSISDRLDQIEARRAQANSSLNGRHMLVGKDVPDMLASLRAVLDIHSPDYFGGCAECPPDVAAPCPTVRAVEDALGEGT